MTPGRLIFPALRWRAGTGFAHEAATIDSALALGVGGFIVFGGTAESVGRLTESLVRDAGRPLLIGADLERGAGQQIAGLSELPPPAAIASLDDAVAVAEAAGALTAREAQSVGINWIYAPVADLDLEADNPIVQTRSFGADPDRVGRLVAAWIRGCQGAGALACAKHFPGHGRTLRDSHDGLPSVAASADHLVRIDLAPFRAAVAAEVGSVMTAHVAFPALDPSGKPATMSAPILARLRRELGFQGLVVSDALMMEGARQGRSAEAAAVDALVAGVDVLLYPPDPVATHAAIVDATGRDPATAAAVDRAAGLLAVALDRVVARTTGAPATAPSAAAPAPAAESLVAAALAARLVRRHAPAGIRLRAPLELVVVDDDIDGAYAASPSDWAERRLAERAVPLGPGGSRVVLAFAEPRASKGRAGFGAASIAAIAAAAPGAALVALFAHPRLGASIAGGPPTVVVWHRQRLMQEAFADWLVERIG